jgi:hypothetical protein
MSDDVIPCLGALNSLKRAGNMRRLRALRLGNFAHLPTADRILSTRLADGRTSRWAGVQLTLDPRLPHDFLKRSRPFMFDYM